MTTDHHHGNLNGIILMIAAMALFGFEDMFLKLSAEGLPTGEILLVTCLAGFCFFGLMAKVEGRRVFSRGLMHPLVITRNGAEVVGSLAYLTAIASVPLPIVAAVLQATPLVITLGAALFMGEHVGWRRWSAIAVGVAGVMLVIRPGLQGFDLSVLWVVLTVVFLAMRDLVSRVVPRDIATSQITAWGTGSVAILGALMIPFQGWVAPTPSEWAMLVGALVFGNAGYWAVTTSTRIGQASVVAPFRYTRLVFVMVISLLVFREVPDRLTLWGSALIIGSGLYAFARERLRARAAAKAGLSSVTNQG